MYVLIMALGTGPPKIPLVMLAGTLLSLVSRKGHAHALNSDAHLARAALLGSAISQMLGLVLVLLAINVLMAIVFHNTQAKVVQQFSVQPATIV